jgi:transposase
MSCGRAARGGLLPNDLPPWGTTYRWFAAWRDDGCFERINHALVMADRERVGRDASPTAAIIDSQSAKTTEAGGPRGYDAGKKINGRKRHALVDTDGRGLVLEPHPASIQDRDGGAPLLRVSRCIFPFIQRVFADSGYAGEKVTTATLIAVEIVRKNPDQVASLLTRGAGSSSGSSPGSGEIGDWQKTSRLPSTPHAPSSTPHPSCYSFGGSLVLRDFRNRLSDNEGGDGNGISVLVTPQGRLQISADLDVKGIGKLKQMLEQYEQILKLLQ